MRFESPETAEARVKAMEHLERCTGFLQLTWGDEGTPVMNAGGISRAEVAYMACYLSHLAISSELEDEEYDA